MLKNLVQKAWVILTKINRRANAQNSGPKSVSNYDQNLSSERMLKNLVQKAWVIWTNDNCLLYTSDAADE